MKYRQICVLGVAGVLTGSFSNQASAIKIKLDENTELDTDKKSYMEVELESEVENES